MSQSSRAPVGYGMSIGAAVAWSVSSVLIDHLLGNGASRLAVALWRDAFIAITCCLIFLIFRRDMLRVSKADIRGLMITGIISIGIYHALWTFSIGSNGAPVATVLAYSYTIFVALGARVLYKESIQRAQWIAIFIALIGCILVVRAYDPQVLKMNWLGGLAGLGTGLAHALYVLYNQRAVQSFKPITSLTYTMLFGSITLVILNLLIAPSEMFNLGTSEFAWPLIIAISLGPTLAGYFCFTSALQYIPGKMVGLLTILEAPAVTILAVIFLGARLELLQIVGLVLVMAAMVIPQLSQKSEPAETLLEANAS
jgi:DME family drug/metabolite transporter